MKTFPRFTWSNFTGVGGRYANSYMNANQTSLLAAAEVSPRPIYTWPVSLIRFKEV